MAVRVGYDEQIFLLQEYGGISRYFVELIKQFRLHPELGIEPVLLSTFSKNRYFLEELNPEVRQVTNRLESIFLLLLTSLRRNIPRAEIDILHHTFYLPGFLNRFKRLPRVSTIFDMIPEISQPVRIWNPHFRKRKYLSGRGAVVSISENSTRDARRIFGLDVPIAITYPGVSMDFAPNLDPLPDFTGRYFLFVGNRGGYKDFTTALFAFAGISAKRKDVALVAVGGGALTRQEVGMIKELKLQDRVIQRSFAPMELPKLFSNSMGLIYTSKLEGFGLPLVEALASGIPVLASSTAINHEIAAESANYFKIGDKEKLKDLLDQLLERPENFASTVRSGIARAREFTWYRCAYQTAEIYKKALAHESEKD